MKMSKNNEIFKITATETIQTVSNNAAFFAMGVGLTPLS